MEDELDSWEGFLGSNWLKPNDITEKDEFVCLNVELEDENKRPRLTLERKGTGENYLFDLNVTNSNFLRDTGIKNPRGMIGKLLTFTTVSTPKGKGLRIRTVK